MINIVKVTDDKNKSNITNSTLGESHKDKNYEKIRILKYSYL